MTKTSSIHLVVLMQYRLVTGGQTERQADRQTHDDNIYHASTALRGKSCMLYKNSNTNVTFSLQSGE